MSMHGVMLQHYVWFSVSASESRGVTLPELVREVMQSMKRDGYITNEEEIKACLDGMPCVILEGTRWKLNRYKKQ